MSVIDKTELFQWKAKFRTYCFVDENQLRAMGYDKTPDIILEVPIGKYLHDICQYFFLK